MLGITSISNIQRRNNNTPIAEEGELQFQGTLKAGKIHDITYNYYDLS